MDLMAYHGAGACNCLDYTCRHEKANAALGPAQAVNPSRCRHIKAARQFACDLLVMGWEKEEQ